MRRQLRLYLRGPTAREFVMVLFGATGDLAQSKLYRALFQLWKRGLLPQRFVILGVSPDSYDDVSYREFVAKCLAKLECVAVDTEFLKHFVYVRADAGEALGYLAVYVRLQELILQHGAAQVLYYFSVPPKLYPSIVRNMRKRPVIAAQERLMIEKPFGRNLWEVEELNQLLRRVFRREDDVYRVDHYLGKSMVRLGLELSDRSSAWHDELHAGSVSGIRVDFLEPSGIGNRGKFYDSVGAVSDMWGHIVETLACLTMEPWSRSVGIQHRRKQIIRAFSLERAILAQYRSANGLLGYRLESEVPMATNTETFCAAHFEINTPRWAGVPVVGVTGKRVGKSKLSRVAFALRGGVDLSFLPGFPVPSNSVPTPKAFEILLDGSDEGTCFRLHFHDDEIPALEWDPPKNNGVCDYAALVYAGLNGDNSFTPSLGEIGAQTGFLEAMKRSAWADSEAPTQYDAGCEDLRGLCGPEYFADLVQVLPECLRGVSCSPAQLVV